MPLPRPLLAALLCASLLAQELENVITLDGRVLHGEVEVADELLRVRTERKDTFLSRVIVSERTPATATDGPPVYLFNQERLEAKKRGEVALVVQDQQWGSWQPDGSIEISMRDPELGRIRFTMLIGRVAPDVFTLYGVEYDHRVSLPLRSGGHIPISLVEASVDQTDLAALFKAARFFATLGDASRADVWLQRAAQLGGPEAELEAGRQAVRQILARTALAELERLLLTGAEDRAGYLADDLRKADVKHALLDELDARLARRDAARKALSELGLAQQTLSVAQADRVLKLLDVLGETNIALDQLPLLLEPWAEAFAGGGLDADNLGEAAELAAAIADFYTQPKDRGARGLARTLERSALPFAVKVALVQHAYEYQAPEEPIAWERFEHDKFHYFVQLPSAYQPDRPWPVLVALHGQMSTAEDVVHTWGAVAERWGMILISPEYVYNRKWGYKNSEEEHLSVLNAVHDAAARFQLDMDRVYLTGHSQGGHASWDIGGSHAGRYAGVVPFIGCSRATNSHDNFENTGLYIVDGSEDALAPKFNRESIMELGELECDATYVEYRGGKHESFAEEFEACARWMLQHTRPAAKPELALFAIRSCDIERNWLRISKPEKKLPETNPDNVHRCWVRAEFADNLFKLRGDGVKEVEVLLSAALVDFSQKLRIKAHGDTKFNKLFEPDWQVALEEAWASRDRSEIFLGRVKVRLD